MLFFSNLGAHPVGKTFTSENFTLQLVIYPQQSTNLVHLFLDIQSMVIRWEKNGFASQTLLHGSLILKDNEAKVGYTGSSRGGLALVGALIADPNVGHCAKLAENALEDFLRAIVRQIA